MKKTIGILAVIIIAIIGIYFWTQNGSYDPDVLEGEKVTTTTTPEEQGGEAEIEVATAPTTEVIGTSVGKRDIVAYHFLPPNGQASGTGDTELLFVGGIHGGYSWNTSLVAYELMDYLEKNPSAVPAKVTVTVIPVLNPDGLSKVVATSGPFIKADVSVSSALRIAGRFNAHKVDLNRNFDCNWKSTGTWQNTPVGGGSAAFSEPESAAVKNYVEKENPAAVVVWYSAVGGVFSSSCSTGVSEGTRTLTNLYAAASGYPAHESFDFYETSGDMANWLAKKNIPAISVLLTTHEDTEWSKNWKGVEAVISHFAK